MGIQVFDGTDTCFTRKWVLRWKLKNIKRWEGIETAGDPEAIAFAEAVQKKQSKWIKHTFLIGKLVETGEVWKKMNTNQYMKMDIAKMSNNAEEMRKKYTEGQFEDLYKKIELVKSNLDEAKTAAREQVFKTMQVFLQRDETYEFKTYMLKDANLPIHKAEMHLRMLIKKHGFNYAKVVKGLDINERSILIMAEDTTTLEQAIMQNTVYAKPEGRIALVYSILDFWKKQDEKEARELKKLKEAKKRAAEEFSE